MVRQQAVRILVQAPANGRHGGWRRTSTPAAPLHTSVRHRLPSGQHQAMAASGRDWVAGFGRARSDPPMPCPNPSAPRANPARLAPADRKKAGGRCGRARANDGGWRRAAEQRRVSGAGWSAPGGGGRAGGYRCGRVVGTGRWWAPGGRAGGCRRGRVIGTGRRWARPGSRCGRWRRVQREKGEDEKEKNRGERRKERKKWKNMGQ